MVAKAALDLAISQNGQLLTFLYALGAVIGGMGAWLGKMLISEMRASTAAATAQAASNQALAVAFGSLTTAVNALMVEIGKKG